MKKYTVERIRIPSGDRAMKLLILRPGAHRRAPEDTPGVLWIHGGGYVVGMAGMVFMSRAKRLAAEYGAVVLSPEYRLAGEAPYPAALEDCRAALLYLKEHAAELGCAPDRIMVGGESAGGAVYAVAGSRRRQHRLSDAAVSDDRSSRYRFLAEQSWFFVEYPPQPRGLESVSAEYLRGCSRLRLACATDGLSQSSARVYVRRRSGTFLL